MISRLSIIFMALSLALALYGWISTPADVQIAIQFAADGTPQKYTNPWPGFFIIPAIQAGVMVLLWGFRFVEPRRANLEASREGVRPMITATHGLITFTQLMIVLAGKGWVTLSAHWSIAAAGVLFVVLGNYMPKIRSNFLAGIRTPWTLSSDVVWQKTHRFGGIIFMLAGLATFAGAVLDFGANPLIVMLVSVGVAALAPVAYSYMVWRQESES